MSQSICGARRPGYELRAPVGRMSIPCALGAGHECAHANAFGDRWTNISAHISDAQRGDASAIVAVLDAMEPLISLYAGGDELRRARARTALSEALPAYAAGDFTTFARHVVEGALADDAHGWAEEYGALSLRWEGLRARLRTDDTLHIREQLRRVDALMAALVGDVAALSR
ncbi:hypothetical protein [Actinacidiphila sp. bgisy167]|uniref:hypothetical protein n=1 Tax=Actinacidiphila sp. bgisy167 TaxID=3413797 RepID=UPI003D7038F8